MALVGGNKTKSGRFNCLVTGGAGFIGHHLVKKLKEFSNLVIAFDNLSTGLRENIDYANPHEFIQGDFTDYDQVRKVFDDFDIDYVFHLGALPRVQFSWKQPIETHEANTTGMLNVLLAAKQKYVNRFVYSSSSSVYGNQDTLPLVETMIPNPLSPYAAQKLLGEYYAKQFYDVFGLQTISLRYFNVYGPRQRAESDYAAAIPKFATQMLKGISPTIFGDGEQTRDFTYVGDVVAANIAAAFVEDSQAYGRVYNIGGGRRVSVNEIVKQEGVILGIIPDPEYLPSVVESRHTLADISLAKKHLGWSPSVNFEDGLIRTMNYVREFNNVNS